MTDYFTLCACMQGNYRYIHVLATYWGLDLELIKLTYRRVGYEEAVSA